MSFDLYSMKFSKFEPELKCFAEQLVAQIDSQEHVYSPRKQRGKRIVVSRGWQQRLQNYEWKPKNDFDGTAIAPDLIAEFKIAKGKKISSDLSDEEEMKLRSLAKLTFEWGGVTRGNSKENPSTKQILAVINSAVDWSYQDDALMDSGWTKIAAFSTAGLEDQGLVPQIIYDSRVAAGLIRNAEKLLLRNPQKWSDDLKKLLFSELRAVSGRDPNKFKSFHLGWRKGSTRAKKDGTHSFLAVFL